MRLIEPNGTIKLVVPRRPWGTSRRVVELLSGDGLIIGSDGEFNEFASCLAKEPVYGPAILCDSDEECP